MLPNKLIALTITLSCIFTTHTMMQCQRPTQGQAAHPHTTGLLDMPSFVIEGEIAPHLPLQDLGHLRQTCRQLRTAWDHQRTLEFNRASLERPYNTRQPDGILTGYINALIRSVSFGYLGHQGHYTLASGLAQLHSRLERLNLQNKVRLNLGGSRLTELPAEIQQLHQLRTLNLWENPLTPEAIKNICLWLPNLQELDLSFNILTELPAELQQLKQLKALYLWGNILTPEAIKNICLWLPNLQVLDLSFNDLTTLPAEIQQLQQLKILHLGNNRLTPEAIKNICLWLPNLQELGLGYNSLTEIPSEIQQLQQLKILDLTGNILTSEVRAAIRQWLPNTQIMF